MWTPSKEDIVTAEQKAEEEKQAGILSYKSAFDNHLDTVAQSKGYDNRISIGTYATSTNPGYVAEAQAFIKWRDNALESMFEQLAAFENEGIHPTIEEFIDNLPKIEWP